MIYGDYLDAWARRLATESVLTYVEARPLVTQAAAAGIPEYALAQIVATLTSHTHDSALVSMYLRLALGELAAPAPRESPPPPRQSPPG